MTRILRRLLPGLALLLASAPNLHAAPVATFTCGGLFTSNLSYFDLGGADPVTAGAITGAAVIKPLTFHTSLSQFSVLFPYLFGNRHIQQCTLAAVLADGSTVQFLLTNLTVSSLDAISRSGKTAKDTPAAYTRVGILFKEIEVKAPTSGDDGGTTGGWDVISNAAPTTTTGGWDLTTNQAVQ